MILHSVGPAHPHSSTTCYGGGQIIRQYTYDLNGNMTQRIEGSNTYTFTYDAENRLVTGAKNGVTLASYTYDGNGVRVKAVENGVTTVYISDYFEWTGSTSTMKKYYYAGGTRVAERVGILSTSYYFLLTDHLGSTSITANSSGSKTAELRYKPWGETRYTSGTTQTTIRYTGQREESSLGLYWYASRWYSPSLSMFLSADTIVPSTGEGNNLNAIGYVANTTYSALTVDYHENQFLDRLNQENKYRLDNPNRKLPGVPTNPLAFDRYASSLNNPVRYHDPTGHLAIVAALALIGPAGWVAIGALALVGTVYYYASGGPEAFAKSVSDLGEQAIRGVNALFAKGEYVPPSLRGEIERNAYREAVHRYKDAFNLGPRDKVPEWILDKIADLLKKGVKPEDIPYKAPQPPEEDDDIDGEED